MATTKTRSFNAKNCTGAVAQLKGLTEYDSQFKRETDSGPTITKPTPPDKNWTVTTKLKWTIGASNIRVTLPDWTDIPSDADCKKAWEEAVRRLSVHEDGHVKICEKLVKDLDALFKTAQSDFTISESGQAKAISEFKKKVDEETKRLKSEYDRLKKETDDTNRKYDKVTTNGQKPGGSDDKWSPAGAKTVVLDCTKCP